MGKTQVNITERIRSAVTGYTVLVLCFFVLLLVLWVIIALARILVG